MLVTSPMNERRIWHISHHTKLVTPFICMMMQMQAQEMSGLIFFLIVNLFHVGHNTKVVNIYLYII